MGLTYFTGLTQQQLCRHLWQATIDSQLSERSNHVINFVPAFRNRHLCEADLLRRSLCCCHIEARPVARAGISIIRHRFASPSKLPVAVLTGLLLSCASAAIQADTEADLQLSAPAVSHPDLDSPQVSAIQGSENRAMQHPAAPVDQSKADEDTTGIDTDKDSDNHY